ncbi:MAG: aldo/keto reductase, partial [Dorea sp.]
MEKINPALVPQRKLNNGMVIPGIGMGTFGNDRYTSEEVSKAVYGAIEAGYRLFDCAAAYGNEKEIGRVFEKAFSEGIVQRQDMTIMTKVWNDMHGKGDVLVACAKSLRDLRLDYLDVYMVHWPFPTYHAPGAHLEGRNPLAVPFSVEEYMGVWRQMEKLVDMGL